MAPDGETVLVTGGTGFVGSHVVDRLIEAGYAVRCTVRASSDLRWLREKPVELVQADLREGGLSAAVAGIGSVIHCAGLTRGRRAALFAANHAATVALLDACVEAGGPRRFVFCSSQAAAGPGELQRPRELGDAPQPNSDYGRSKLAAEEEVRGRADRLDVTVLRPAAVYGPRDRDTLPYFRMAARGIVVAPGLRERKVQLVHARDVASALARALERPQAIGETLFVAHPEILSWTVLARRIGDAVDRRPLRLRVPSPLLRGLGVAAGWLGLGEDAGQIDPRRARDLAQRAWTCRVDRTLERLDWRPEYDSIAGLRNTADWYREHGWL